MPRHNRSTFPDSFWSKISVKETQECWPWNGVLTDGYGRFSLDSVYENAHRIAYEIAKGPIPEGLQIDHLCRNRACCNPAHLEAVTCQTNILRGEGLAARNVRKTHCPIGHEFTAENTRILPSGSRTCRICGREEVRARRASARLSRI